MIPADYQPATPEERGHLEAMRALAEHPDCRSRIHWRPGHFTASAFVLSPDDTALLLIHHSKLDLWIQPGGHVDPTDADLLAAARREVAEETGLTDLTLLEGPFDLDVHTIPAQKTEPAHGHFDVRFLFRSASWDFQAGSDALAARWVPLEDVFALDSDESVFRATRKVCSRRA